MLSYFINALMSTYVLQQPLIKGSAILFQRIVELDHPHVIKVLEYIAGKYIAKVCR